MQANHFLDFFDGSVASDKLLECCVEPGFGQQFFNPLDVRRIGPPRFVRVATRTRVDDKQQFLILSRDFNSLFQRGLPFRARHVSYKYGH